MLHENRTGMGGCQPTTTALDYIVRRRFLKRQFKPIMKYKQTAFFIGHFEITDTMRIKDKLKELKWKREEPDKNIENLKNIFYEDFYKFCFSSTIGQGIVAYEKTIDKTIFIKPVKRPPLNLRIVKSKVFLLPFNMMMFYIEIEQSNVSANDICFTNRCLRNIKKYNDMHEQWAKHAIKPLIMLYNQFNKKDGDRANLVGKGYRLKTFQIIEPLGDEEAQTDAIRKEQLYKFGTLSYTLNPDESTGINVTNEHLDFIMNENSIYVQTDWRALVLLDTFTVEFYKEGQNTYIQDFRNYCRTIYIHALFQKYYLFQLNQKHFLIQKEDVSITSYIRSLFYIGNTSIEKLAHDMRVFETKCSFNNIGYIYLPIMVHKYISKGLDVHSEKQSICNIVNAEKEEIDEISNKTVNVILLALSFFSFMSAILDACDLINHITPFAQWLPTKSVGYGVTSLILTLALLSIVVVFTIFGRYNARRNKRSLIRHNNDL